MCLFRPSECFGIKGFTAKWLLRVVGMPLACAVLVVSLYIYNRCKQGARKAWVEMKGHVFMCVFFCYPTICIVSFAAFICRAMGPNTSILESDDQIRCEDPSHEALQGVSGVVVALVAFGLPVVFSYILVKSARDYEKTAKGENAEMAEQLAAELSKGSEKVDLEVAEFVIRDVQIGEDYSFLMDAYTPKYLYW